MAVIAIIGIKTDSKQLPNKAFRHFCGLPLWQWIFQAATDCKYIDKIVLSCTDKWVADEVKKVFPKVTWVNRPKELNGDTELLEVTKHAFKKVAKNGDTCIQLQPSKPMTTNDLISKIIIEYRQQKYDSLFTIQKIIGCINGEYKTEIDKKNKYNYRSLSVVKIWSYNAIINAKKGTWGYGDRHGNYIVDARHIEIDSLLDFKIAEALKKAGL
jgi:CMP-N-acetylneuraminic acid synthetase